VSQTKTFNDNIGAFGWPPILPTATAAAYCSVSKRTLKRAVASGALQVAGHRGRSMTFRREDLDRWLLGESGTPSTTGGGAKSDALARLRTLTRNGQ
jgi:excisionase family DNA binding protein